MSFWISLILGAVVLFFFAVIAIPFCVSLIEKQRVKFLAKSDLSQAPSSSAYFAAVNRMVAEMDFQGCGFYAHPERSRIYADYAALWVAPDADALLLVRGGKIAKINVRRTLLISEFDDGTFLQSHDEFDCPDFGNTVLENILLKANPRELYDSHKQLLLDSGKTSRRINADEALEFLEHSLQSRFRGMARTGFMKSIDSGETLFRYTVRGAWKVAWNIFQNESAEKNRDRLSLKRPGEK
jgi:hypothetical protein